MAPLELAAAVERRESRKQHRELRGDNQELKEQNRSLQAELAQVLRQNEGLTQQTQELRLKEDQALHQLNDVLEKFNATMRPLIRAAIGLGSTVALLEDPEWIKWNTDEEIYEPQGLLADAEVLHVKDEAQAYVKEWFGYLRERHEGATTYPTSICLGDLFGKIDRTYDSSISAACALGFLLTDLERNGANPRVRLRGLYPTWYPGAWYDEDVSLKLRSSESWKELFRDNLIYCLKILLVEPEVIEATTTVYDRFVRGEANDELYDKAHPYGASIWSVLMDYVRFHGDDSSRSTAGNTIQELIKAAHLATP
jgi:ElaB/YqjD/DUF883 family membrane-anchored ribosome-binding protein